MLASTTDARRAPKSKVNPEIVSTREIAYQTVSAEQLQELIKRASQVERAEELEWSLLLSRYRLDIGV